MYSFFSRDTEAKPLVPVPELETVPSNERPFEHTGRLLSFGPRATSVFEDTDLPEGSQCFFLPLWLSNHPKKPLTIVEDPVYLDRVRERVPVITESSLFLRRLINEPDKDMLFSLFCAAQVLTSMMDVSIDRKIVLFAVVLFDEEAATAIYRTYSDFPPSIVGLRHKFCQLPSHATFLLQNDQVLDTSGFPAHLKIHRRLFVCANSYTSSNGLMLKELPSSSRMSPDGDFYGFVAGSKIPEKRSAMSLEDEEVESKELMMTLEGFVGELQSLVHDPVLVPVIEGKSDAIVAIFVMRVDYSNMTPQEKRAIFTEAQTRAQEWLLEEDRAKKEKEKEGRKRGGG